MIDMDFLKGLDAGFLKGLAAVASICASLLLAWCVTDILKALALVASAHEINIHELASDRHHIQILTNSPQHIENAQRTGLLVAGFLLLFAAGVLNLLSLFV